MKNTDSTFFTEILYNVCYFKKENEIKKKKLELKEEKKTSESKYIQTSYINNDNKKQNNNDIIKYIIKNVVKCFVCIFILFIIWAFYSDIKAKYIQEINKVNKDISFCKKEYYDNRCENPVPELEIFCAERYKCLNSNPKHYNFNIKILTELFSDIINNIFKKLSYKTIVILGVVSFIFIKIK